MSREIRLVILALVSLLAAALTFPQGHSREKHHLLVDANAWQIQEHQ